MASCDSIKPILFRTAEGDADPGGAIRVARHVSDCTACRILLARERRLATMLEEGLEDLPVGEEFVRNVMQTLPQGPSAARRRRRHRRGLKLAGIGGLIAGPALLVARFLPRLGFDGITPALPSFGSDSVPSAVEGLYALLQVVAMALRAAAAQVPLDLPGTSIGFPLALLLLVGGLFGLAGSTALAVIARSLARSA